MAYRVALGADHGGFALKISVAEYLKREGHDVQDFGTFSEDPCDYPPYSFAAAEAVAQGRFEFGVLMCRSGIGMAICANKVKGVRAARCENVTQARLARQHNDANVLVLAGDFVSKEAALDILAVFLGTRFEGGRHERRVKQINDYDAKHISNS